MPMEMPALVPHWDGQYTTDDKGNKVPQVQYLRYGVEIEPDPDRPGYARWRHMKGSVCRAGKGYIGLGLETADLPLAVPAAVPGPPFVPGVTGELSFTPAIRESGWLGQHILYGVPVAPTLSVFQIAYRNDGLVSGNVPANIFVPGSFYNPTFGHFIRENVSLIVQYRNFGAAAQDLMPGWILL